MPKRTSQKVPENAIIVRTYDEFFHEVDAFGHGERNLLIVIGPAGARVQVIWSRIGCISAAKRSKVGAGRAAQGVTLRPEAQATTWTISSAS